MKPSRKLFVWKSRWIVVAYSALTQGARLTDLRLSPEEIAGSASIGANRRPAAGLIQQVQLSFYDKKAGTNLREFSIPQGSIVSKIDPGVVSVSYPTGEMIFLSVQRGVRGMIRLQSTAGFPKSGKRAAFKARGSGSDRCIPSYND